MAQPETESDPFDPAELREWSRDPRGQPFWDGLREMGNKRMDGVRQALRSGNQHDAATHLAGELEAIDEVRQLIDLLIAEFRIEQKEKKESE